MIKAIVIVLVAGILCSTGVGLFLLLARRKVSLLIDGINTSPLKKETEEINLALDGARTYLDSLAPSDKALALEKKLVEQQKAITASEENLQTLEKEATELRQACEDMEKSQKDQSQARIEMQNYATDLRNKQQELSQEFNRAQNELRSTGEQLKVLKEEVELSEAQKNLVVQISNTFETALAQLEELNKSCQQAKTRYLSLEGQFNDLEEEFKKLLAKEPV